MAPAIAEALERPEVREQVARNMGNAELAGVVETAARVGRDRGHAERAERDGRDRGPTIDDVAPGETREELEASVTQWIDDALIRVYYRTGELYRTFQKYGGNTGMDRGEAIEKLRRGRAHDRRNGGRPRGTRTRRKARAKGGQLMAPARSAIGRAIQAAIALTHAKGQPMSPSNVWANCQTAGLWVTSPATRST